MKLRRILLIVAAVASMAVQCAMAQKQAREQWMDQINQYKRTYSRKNLTSMPSSRPNSFNFTTR